MKEAVLSFSRELEGRLDALETNAAFVADSLKIEIGDEVIRVLKEKDWSRSDLARALKRSRQYVTKMLKGDTNFTLESIASLSIALNKEFHFVFADRGTSIRWLGVVEGGKETKGKEQQPWPSPSTPSHYFASADALTEKPLPVPHEMPIPEAQIA